MVEVILNWFLDNVEWLLGGIVPTTIIAIIGWFFIKPSNKQIQKSGDNSNNIQIGGNITINQNGKKDDK